MSNRFEAVSLHGKNITYCEKEDRYILLHADEWADNPMHGHNFDLQLGEAPPYQHLAVNPYARPDYIPVDHLIAMPPPLADFVLSNPGISYTDRGLEIDASQAHSSGMDWLNGTPLIMDVTQGLSMRAIVTHEGAANPAGYDGYVHIGFRANTGPAHPDEAFFGVGLFGQGAGPNPFPGARTIATGGAWSGLQSTYPQTASFDAGEAVLMVAHWGITRGTGTPARVRLTVDFWGLDFGHQETATFESTLASDIEKFVDLHGQPLYPAISTYHPGTVQESSTYIISEFRARS